MPSPRRRRAAAKGSIPRLFWQLDAETIAQSDGTAVSAWSDTSPSVLNLAQATGARQPTYKTGIINGLPVVRFAAASVQWMKTAAIPLVQQPGIVFVVCAYATFSNNCLLDGVSSSNRWVVDVDSAQHPDIFAGNNLGAPTAVTGTGFNIISNVFNVGASAIYLNGAKIAAGIAGTMPCDGFHLGSYFGEGTLLMDGDVAAIRAYQGKATDAFRRSVERALSNKYNIAVI